VKEDVIRMIFGSTAPKVAAALLIVGISLGVQGQKLGGPAGSPTPLDIQVANLRKAIEQNDSLMRPPTGWHWVKLQAPNGGKGIMADDPNVGVKVEVASSYEIKDPIMQLKGIGARAERYAGGIGSLFWVLGSRYNGITCSEVSRHSELRGYLFANCSARDVVDDSLHYVWFFVNGVSIECIWMAFSTQSLVDKYEPMLRDWMFYWVQRRAMTQSQQNELAVLLKETVACKYKACP
jgi:hypothetical protein